MVEAWHLEATLRFIARFDSDCSARSRQQTMGPLFVSSRYLDLKERIQDHQGISLTVRSTRLRVLCPKKRCRSTTSRLGKSQSHQGMQSTLNNHRFLLFGVRVDPLSKAHDFLYKRLCLVAYELSLQLLRFLILVGGQQAG